MKKDYIKPAQRIITIQPTSIFCQSDGTGVHNDDPQHPGNAMSRGHHLTDWDDDGDWDDDDTGKCPQIDFEKK